MESALPQKRSDDKMTKSIKRGVGSEPTTFKREKDGTSAAVCPKGVLYFCMCPRSLKGIFYSADNTVFRSYDIPIKCINQ